LIANNILFARVTCIEHLTIISPRPNVQSMIENWKISNRVKIAFIALSHSLFQTRLISKAQLTGTDVLIPPNERATTKACGKCFDENPNIGGSETFWCRDENCNFRCGRDHNAPRNIFIRQLRF